MSDAAPGGFACGTSVYDQCKDLQIPWGEEWTFQMLMGDLIDALQALLKFGVQYIGTSLTDNMLKGVNALRCAVTNVGENSWNLIAALYWAAMGAGQGDLVKQYLDLGYEHVCTCQEDAKMLIEAMGAGGDGGRAAYMLGTCSESGQVKKNDAGEAKRNRDLDRARANLKALKDAAFARIKKQKEEEMKELVKGSGGKQALEKEQLAAFKAFKEKSKALEDKEDLTESEKEELEKLQQEYEAVKQVKEEIIKEEVSAEIDQIKGDGGIAGLQTFAEDTADELNALTKKLEEFPDDEDVLLHFKEVETKMDLIKQTFNDLSNSDSTSVEETEALQELE